MSVAASIPGKMSLRDFLEWETSQNDRWELVDGVPYAMAGGTLASNRISLNIAGSLNASLRNRGCEAFAENVKVFIKENVFYPDVVVACGEMDY